MTDTFNIYNEKEEQIANGVSPVDVQKLTPATKYNGWKITRKNERGESDKVAIQEFVTIPLNPTLSVTAGDTKVDYKITNSAKGSEISDYKIYYTNGATSSIFDAKVSLTGSISGLENDKEYTFQVTAKNAGGESEKSDSVKATPKKSVD